MAKTKDQKKEIMKAYVEKLKASKCIVVVSPRKLTANDVVKFKKDIFETQSSFNVVKNTVFKIALKEAGLPEVEDLNNGEHAVLFSGEDFVSAIKQLKKFMNDTKVGDDYKISVVSGILDGQALTKDQVVELSDLPTFEGSLSQIVGILNMALSSVVTVAEDPVRSYMSIIEQAYANK